MKAKTPQKKQPVRSAALEVRFPLIRSASRNPRTHVDRAKRTQGETFASGALSFRNGKATVQVKDSKAASAVTALQKGAAILLEKAKDSFIGAILDKALKAQASFPIHITRNSSSLMAFGLSKSKMELFVDANVDSELKKDADSLGVVFAMGLLNLLHLVLGKTEREAAHACLGVYQMLSAKERARLIQLLRESLWDSGGCFSIFLHSTCDATLAMSEDKAPIALFEDVDSESIRQLGVALKRCMDTGKDTLPTALNKTLKGMQANIELTPSLSSAWVKIASSAAKTAFTRKEQAEILSAAESSLKWRDKWVTWVFGRLRLDIPYNQWELIDLLSTEMEDVDEKRALVNQAISQSFDWQVEGTNIERISDWALENDVHLVGGRLSRAFGNQAHLLSAARYVTDRSCLKEPVEKLTRLSADIDALQTHTTRISSLVSRAQEVPYAQLKGAIDQFEQTLIDFQNDAQKDAVARRNSSAESVFHEPVSEAKQTLTEMNAKFSEIYGQIDKVRQALAQAPKRDASYVIMLQRLHPAETINLAHANSVRDVHPGKEEDLRDLVRLGGHNTYSCPGNGEIEVNGNRQPVNWITKVGDWIEAIPLFIHERVVRKSTVVAGKQTDVDVIETAVDQEAMEAFFRAHAEYWAQNIDEVCDSFAVDIARTLCVERTAALNRAAQEIQQAGMTWNEAARQIVCEDPKLHRDIALIAASVLHSSEQCLSEIAKTIETKQVSRLQAMREVLLGSPDKAPSCLLSEAFALCTKFSPKAFAQACRNAAPKKTQKQLEITAERLLVIVPKKSRKTPNLHILTTESAGMTEGYVQSWIEEEMALYNVIRGRGLEGKVAERMARYRERISAIGQRVIDEFGMSVVVDEVIAEQKLNRAQAAMTVIYSYKVVSEEVGRLATLLEHFKTDELGNLSDCSEPQEVLDYLQEHRGELEETCVPQVVQNNGHAFQMRLADWMDEHPDTESSIAERAVIRSDADYEAELQSLVLSSARVQVLAQEDVKHPSLGLVARSKNYLREYTQMAKSTARKQVLASEGLQSLTLNPIYCYQASGPNKRYNLLYTPSRVNLGEHERDSVAVWKQWVGGADWQAAQAGFNFYSLINEGGVEERPALAHAEIQKTSENALCVTHFAGSNALGLLISAVLEGDAEDMADQMNLRGDRYIPPAGEGYGGYCVPKDGLFLAFVLSLSNDVKLRQMGIPEHLHKGIMALAKKAILKRQDFTTDFEWQDWAAKHLLKIDQLKEYFELKEDGLLVFHITKIATAIQHLGQPWGEVASGSTLLSNLAARWSVEHMIINAEQVNRFMTFYKAWLIYEALAEARRFNPYAPKDNQARIALTAEYKPVQDVRFSTGMRLFEMFANTYEHLTHALDEEGQNLAYLMLKGFDPETENPLGQRAVQEVFEKLGVAANDPSTIERLKEAFPKHESPADIVMTSVTQSSIKDMLFYTSDTRLDQIADRVQVKLGDFGLSEEQIIANCQAFGGNLRAWAGLRQIPAEQLDRITSEIGGEIHALVLKLRGPGRNYEKDVQGVDVLNTGIPFPELLELLDNPPKLVRLMLMGNPNSALGIADGTSGRNRRSLTYRDVQNFLAACEREGKRGVYKAVGLGTNNVERLRADMREKRDRASTIYSALLAVAQAQGARETTEAVERAQEVYTGIVERILVADEPGKAIREEERLKRYKKWKPGDPCISEALARLRTGLPLQELDVATWLGALGGMFTVMGEPQKEIDEQFQVIEKAVGIVRQWAKGKKLVSAFTGHRATKSDIADAIKYLVRPKFVPEVQQFAQEMLVESSSKAVEVAAIEALERRQALRARAARAQAFGQREEGFLSVYDPQQKSSSKEYAKKTREEMAAIMSLCKAQMNLQGEVDETASEQCHRAFGRFLAFTRNYLVSLGRRAYANGTDEDIARLAELEADAAKCFSGREVIMEDWKLLAGGYENLGDLARLAEKVKGNKAFLMEVAEGVEFFYVTLALAQTLEFALEPKQEVDIRLFWKRAMDFFAETINDHFYPYAPWAFCKGIGFAEYEGEDLYKLANEHHNWLYEYLYAVLVSRTDYADLPEVERDALVGNFSGQNMAVPIGADACGTQERRWRAYNQLREVVFLRGDGFQAPVVFPEFDPDIIEAQRRVNLVFLYPVGRTHISRAFREGPTLNRQLRDEGEPGLNLIVTRHGELTPLPVASRECLMISDGHLYLSEEEYIQALIQHKAMTAEQAQEEASKQRLERRLTDKGIRAAVRFTNGGQRKTLVAAAVFPFHGNPMYEDGKLEAAGLPATVQSTIFTDITYDKSLYPDIYDKKSGVRLPEEIDWKRQYGKGKDEKAIMQAIEKGVKGTSYQGIVQFSKKCPIVLIKGAAESGARNLKVFDLTGSRTEDIQAAVQFVYEVGKKQNVVIQEAVLTSPEFWASNELMDQFIERQILEWNRSVNRDKHPRSQIYGSLRVVASSSGPERPYDTAFLISLISLQVATNVGRGGTLEPLMAQYIQEEHREAILEGLKGEVPKVMDALARYAETYTEEFEQRHGRPVLSDLRGVPYSWPAYMMSDYLVAPVFARPGKLVDIEPKYDESGRRVGSRVVLEDAEGRFEGKITDWQFIHLEPNIGIGLWDRYNLREEEMERCQSDAENRPFDWTNVGKSDRIVLRNFAIAGSQYLQANMKG